MPTLDPSPESSRTAPRRAVFLDRDGTLIQERNYLSAAEQIEPLAGSVEAVRRINRAGLLAVVVTNQSGVARGLFDEERLIELHARLRDVFAEGGARLDAIYYCPHHPAEGSAAYRKVCDCRKPEPGLLLKAAAELDITLSKSYMIGDDIRDVQAGRRAGCRTLLVRTGHGRAAFEKTTSTNADAADHVATHLLPAVLWILEKELERRPA